jgi:hypothetical protein
VLDSIISTTAESARAVELIGYVEDSIRSNTLDVLPKLEQPSFLGKRPSTPMENIELIEYNLRDSQITYDFMKFLINSFEDLGATFKITLPSTAMSLFRNRFLKETYYVLDDNILLEQFESYYGGRTEAFKRGKIEDYNYYDFNSLYPSVMESEVYPQPNSLRITNENTTDYIINYDGVSEVDIFIPYMKYPPLPHRTDEGRVIFPHGNISGWYTHVELRYCLSLGCKIKKVYKTQYFNESCRPFKDYVNTLYKLRQKYQKQNSPLELVIKLFLNYSFLRLFFNFYFSPFFFSCCLAFP